MATTVSTERYARSRELFSQAQGFLAGGNSRLTVFFQPHPLYIERGEAHVYDVDGNEYLDVINNYTSLIHGHANPEIEAPPSRPSGLAPPSPRRRHPRSGWVDCSASGCPRSSSCASSIQAPRP